MGRFPWCVIACSSSVLWSLGKVHAWCTLSSKELCSTSLIPMFISYCLFSKPFICVSKDAQIICFILWIIIQLVFIFKLPVRVCACEGKCLKRTEEVSDPLELKFQAVVSHPEWLLGNKPGSSLQPPFLFLFRFIY